MTKTDLIATVAEKACVPKTEAKVVLDAALESIMDAVAKKESVAIAGFGTFESKHRKERTGRNPQTGEATVIAACNTPKFKAGKAFKDRCN